MIMDFIKKLLPSTPITLIDPKDQPEYDFGPLFDRVQIHLEDFCVFTNPNKKLFESIYPELKRLLDTACNCEKPIELASLYYHHLVPLLIKFIGNRFNDVKKPKKGDEDLYSLNTILNDNEVQLRVIKSILYIKEAILVLLFNDLYTAIIDKNETEMDKLLSLIINRVSKFKRI